MYIVRNSGFLKALRSCLLRGFGAQGQYHTSLGAQFFERERERKKKKKSWLA